MNIALNHIFSAKITVRGVLFLGSQSGINKIDKMTILYRTSVCPKLPFLFRCYSHPGFELCGIRTFRPVKATNGRMP